MQLFMFSAVTWNRHLIHYNQDFAQHDGLQNVAVHRALLGGFLTQMLTEWLGMSGQLVSLDWSVRGSATLNQPVTCRGVVVQKVADEGRYILRCDVEVLDHQDRQIVPGKAVVELTG